MRRKHDPLLAALIAKLPPAGTEWPVERQMAWLSLMAMAFGTVYGGDASERIAAKPAAAAAKAAAPAVKPPPSYPFLIDGQGFVRKGNALGKRVLPGEVTDIIHDLRGMDGDLKTIVWADGSSGLNGHDLTIVGAA